ncbi:MAG: hypothetical protein ACOC1K_05920 [Nanoarchaeota archaeon]
MIQFFILLFTTILASLIIGKAYEFKVQHNIIKDFYECRQQNYSHISYIEINKSKFCIECENIENEMKKRICR